MGGRKGLGGGPFSGLPTQCAEGYRRESGGSAVAELFEDGGGLCGAGDG